MSLMVGFVSDDDSRCGLGLTSISTFETRGHGPFPFNGCWDTAPVSLCPIKNPYSDTFINIG